MRHVVFAILAVGATAVLAAEPAVTSAVPRLHPKDYYGTIAQEVARMFPEVHLSHKAVDDETAGRAFDTYLKSLDPEHRYFLAADVERFATNRLLLDDQVLAGQVGFAYDVFNCFLDRVSNRCDYVETLLKTELDLERDETCMTDRTEADWPANEAERDEVWRKWVKNEYVHRIVAQRMAKAEEKKALTNAPPVTDGATPPATNRPPVVVEEKKSSTNPPPSIAEIMIKNYRRFQTIYGNLDADSILERYLSSFAQSYDPHCAYMAPASVNSFEVEMKLALGGIGATLAEEDGLCKVMSIVPDSPAGRDKRDIRLAPGDKIVGVAQADDASEDVKYWPLSRIVSKIRGKKGTRVVLTVIPASDPSGTTTKLVDLVRDEVKLRDRGATGRIRDVRTPDGGTNKIGVVVLPSFYGGTTSDTQRRLEERSCSRDLAKVIRRLEREGAKGIVLDLRNNGGGSLWEAVLVSGLFFRSGPVVMVREGRSVSVLPDEDLSVTYAGPLVVLVNRHTASASEIVAGALQDYGRAIIVGDTKTHGKGSVQCILKVANKDRFGSVKVTNALYYRITGSSTQLKGVRPDVVVRSPLDFTETGEDFLPNPLEWTRISPSRFWPSADLSGRVRMLAEASAKRLAGDKRYGAYTNLMCRIQTLSEEKEISLNLSNRMVRAQQIKALQNAIKEFESEPGEDDEEDAADKDAKPDRQDLVLNETLSILTDFMKDYPDDLAFLDETPTDELPEHLQRGVKELDITKADVPEARRTEILALIGQLQDKESSIRKKATDRLRELIRDARPFLEDHRTSDDPEVRMTVKELLSE